MEILTALATFMGIIMDIFTVVAMLMATFSWFSLVFVLFGDKYARRDFFRSGDAIPVFSWIAVAALLLTRFFF